MNKDKVIYKSKKTSEKARSLKKGRVFHYERIYGRILVICVCCIFICPSILANPGLSETYNFGVIQQGQIVSHSFIFTNKENNTIKLRVLAEPVTLKTRFGKILLRPGDTTSIVLTYRSTLDCGLLSIESTIQAMYIGKSQPSKEFHLILKGEVLKDKDKPSGPAIHFAKPVYLGDTVRNFQILKHYFLFSNTGNGAMLPRAVNVKNAERVLYPLTEIQPGGSGIVILMTYPKNYGLNEAKADVYFNNCDSPVRLYYSYFYKPHGHSDGDTLSFGRLPLQLGEVPKGQNQSFEIIYRNTGNLPLQIEEVQPSCGCMKVETKQDTIFPGHCGTIKVSLKAGNILEEEQKAIGVKLKGSNTFKLVLVNYKVIQGNLSPAPTLLVDTSKLKEIRLAYGQSAEYVIPVQNTGSSAVFLQANSSKKSEWIHTGWKKDSLCPDIYYSGLQNLRQGETSNLYLRVTNTIGKKGHFEEKIFVRSFTGDSVLFSIPLNFQDVLPTREVPVYDYFGVLKEKRIYTEGVIEKKIIYDPVGQVVGEEFYHDGKIWMKPLE